MFKVNRKTFMQSVLDDELKSFHKSNVPTNVKTEALDDFKNGHILFKIPVKKKFMDDMLTSLRNPVIASEMDHETSNNNFHDSRHSDGLFENVTDQIINIDSNATYSECLNTIINYKNALKDNFYGAVLRTPSNSLTLNPFHILTALSVMNDEKYLAKKYNIIIYAYRDREQLNEFTKNHVSDHSLVNQNIDALMNAYMSRVGTESRIVKDDSTTQDKTKDYLTVKVQTKKFADEDPDCNHYISGTQLLTRGVLAPFYGVSLIKMNGSTSGLRLTPFGSCNIGSDAGNPIPNPTPSYGSVCTGSLNNRTLHGLRSLSHANLSSPYGGGFIQNGCLSYADIMIEKCISLYESAELIEAGKNIPLELVESEASKIVYSKEELQCKTLMQYYKLCRIDSNLPSTSVLAKDRYYAMDEWRANNPFEESEVEPELSVSYHGFNVYSELPPAEFNQFGEVAVILVDSEPNYFILSSDDEWDPISTETAEEISIQSNDQSSETTESAEEDPEWFGFPAYSELPQLSEHADGSVIIIINNQENGHYYEHIDNRWARRTPQTAELIATQQREGN